MKRVALSLALACVFASGCRSSEPRPSQESGTVRTPDAPAVPALPSERARAHTELGASYLQIGRVGVALEELTEAVKADPSYVPAHGTLGLVYMELKEDTKAAASFEKALRLDPTNPDANNYYGLFLCNRKREKESIRFFLAAIRNPLYATPEDAYVNAGICSNRAGDTSAAQGYLERALLLRQDEPRALVGLARLHFEQRSPTLARPYMIRFMQGGQPPDAATLWLAARIERVAGDANALASYGSQLKSRFPGSDEARLFEQGRFQ